MISKRHEHAWVWVAVAALSIAMVARTQSGVQSARTYTHPVLLFFAGHPADAAPGVGVAQHANRSKTRRAAIGTSATTFAAVLPVLFVGLVSPLNLVSTGSFLCIGRAPAAPALPFSFQRPPPSILL